MPIPGMLLHAHASQKDMEASLYDYTLLTAFVLLALVFSFLCSIAEAALLSITPAYIQGALERKPHAAKLLQRLRQDQVDRSLAAILTLNTIAHTVGAVAAGAKATEIFGHTWVGVFSALLTLAILFFSEIIPKTIGAVYWSQLAMPTIHFIRLLILLLYPLIIVSEALTQLIAKNRPMHVFSRKEFAAMADLGHATGSLRKRESLIIRNLFHSASLTANDIMTPRTVIAALPASLSVNEAVTKQLPGPFSRIPIYGKNIDDILGMVLKDEILLAQAKGQGEHSLQEFKRDLPAVPDTKPLPDLFEFFLNERQHIALVVDEYGGAQGLVSLEDALETLLGDEIVDEMDRVDDMRKMARKQWSKRARSLGLKEPS